MTTQIGLAKAYPIELETPLGALFSNFGGPGGVYAILLQTLQ